MITFNCSYLEQSIYIFAYAFIHIFNEKCILQNHNSFKLNFIFKTYLQLSFGLTPFYNF